MNSPSKIGLPWEEPSIPHDKKDELKNVKIISSISIFLGLVSLIWAIFGIFSIAFGIIGLKKNKKREQLYKILAITGIVLGLISLTYTLFGAIKITLWFLSEKPEITIQKAPLPPFKNISLDERKEWKNLLLWSDQCEEEFLATHSLDEGDNGYMEIYTLSDSQYLASVTCTTGAYQPSSIFISFEISNEKIASSQLLDLPGFETKEISGLGYFNQNGSLSILSKSRGLGDCGTYAVYNFNEKGKPVLSEYRYQSCDSGSPGWESWPVWQTYTNSQYEFEIKYPKDWTLNDIENPKGKAYSAYIHIASKEKDVQFDIIILGDNSEKLSAKELANQASLDSSKIKEEEINGIPMAVYEHKNSNPVIYYFPDIYITSNRAKILIQGLGKTETDKSVFNQILSTFRFLE